MTAVRRLFSPQEPPSAARVAEPVAPVFVAETALMLPDGRHVTKWRNPAPDALHAILQRSQSKALRGLLVGDEMVWWDAYEADVSDIAMSLNHRGGTRDCFDLRLSGDVTWIDFCDETWPYDRWKQHVQLRQFLESSLIHFYANMAWMDGPHWSLAHENLEIH